MGARYAILEVLNLVEDICEKCCWWWTATELDDAGILIVIGVNEAPPLQASCTFITCSIKQN
jgi:hypothetical protein